MAGFSETKASFAAGDVYRELRFRSVGGISAVIAAGRAIWAELSEGRKFTVLTENEHGSFIGCRVGDQHVARMENSCLYNSQGGVIGEYGVDDIFEGPDGQKILLITVA